MTEILIYLGIYTAIRWGIKIAKAVLWLFDKRLF